MLLLIRSGLVPMMHLARVEFRLGNDYACEIVGVGDVQLKFHSMVLPSRETCAKAHQGLGQLDDAGFSCVFGDSSWKITKGSLVVARGSKSGTLYMLHVSTVKNHVICVTK